MKSNGLKKAIAVAGAVGAMMCPMLANAADSPETTPTVDDVAKEGSVKYDEETGKVTSFEVADGVEDGYQEINLGNGPEMVYIKDGKYNAELDSTADFVAGFYQDALGRGTDKAGLDDWVNQLASEEIGGAELAHGFFASAEYLENAEKNAADVAAKNAAIVDDFYKVMLGRTADEEGKAYWVARLNAGMTVDALVQGFAYSAEFAEKCVAFNVTPGSYQPTAAVDQNYERTAFASRLYTEALGRGYDNAGLEDWCGRLDAGQSGAQVAYGFVFSQEMNDKNLSDEAFVEMLYKAIFGREADPEGLQNWINALTVHTREEVFDLFTDSVEFGNLCDKAGIAVK